MVSVPGFGTGGPSSNLDDDPFFVLENPLAGVLGHSWLIKGNVLLIVGDSGGMSLSLKG